MNEKAIIRLVRSATLKINYAGHTILVDPVFADKGTLQSALGVYKSPRVHLVMPISESIDSGGEIVNLCLQHGIRSGQQAYLAWGSCLLADR